MPSVLRQLGSLLQHLKRRGQQVRSSAPVEEPEDPSLEGLMRRLSDPEAQRRRKAAYALASLGRPEAEPAIPALRIALQDRDPNVCQGAAYALGMLGAVESVPELIQAIDEEEPLLVRREAAYALSALGPASVEAVEALSLLLEDRSAPLRQAAADALGSIGPEARAAAARLGQALSDQDKSVRRAAAMALAEMAPEDFRSTLPQLNEAARDEEKSVRVWAFLALARADAQETDSIDALAGFLDDTDPILRYTTALILGKLGSRSQRVADRLRQALRDPDKQVRQTAARSLEATQGITAAGDF